MRNLRLLPLAVAVGAVWLTPFVPMASGSPAPAAGKSRRAGKRPSAPKQLVAAYKNLVKARSFHVSVRIEGGLSDNSEHRVTTANVTETYEGDVFRHRLMYVPELKAYRTPKNGVAKVGGIWKSILADRESGNIRMHRLFHFPETILKRAVRHARTATWKDALTHVGLEPPPASTSIADEDDIFDSDEESDDDERDIFGPGDEDDVVGDGPSDDEKRRGRTKVAGDDNEKIAKTPRFVRVETTTREALKHFVEVENSGCFGGG